MRLFGKNTLLFWLATTCAVADAFHSPPVSSPLSTTTTTRNNNQRSSSDGGVVLYLQSDSSWSPPPHWKFTGIQRGNKSKNKQSSSQHHSFSPDGFSTDGAIMPDGGLNPCIIKVIGVGGGGCNAVDRMLDTAVGGVDFWSLNTDAQALGRSKAKGAKVLNIGGVATRGLGAGGNPDIGRAAAEESRKEIEAMVASTDLCFVTAGMGGGTGSGAAPVVAEVAKEGGCLTVGIVTKPFVFEGKRRMKQARGAIERLRAHVDTVIVVSNDRLLEIIPEDTPMERAFAVADDILRQGVVGISDIIVKPGLINVDFADVRSVMSNAGTALMGIGIGSGKTAAEDAAAAAISSPLLDATIDNAKGVVFNISGGDNLSLNEVNRAARTIYATVEPDANVIFGALTDESLGDSISITVLATGFATNDDPAIQEAAKGQKAPKQAGKQQTSMKKSGGGRKAAAPRRAAAAPAAQQQQQQQYEEPRYEQQPPAAAQQQQQRYEEPRYEEPPPPPRRRQREQQAPPPPPPPADDDDDVVPDFLKSLKRRS